VQRNEERCAAPSSGQRIGVRDGPSHVGFSAEARTGEQCPELLKREAERQWRSQRIGSCKQRHALAAGIGHSSAETSEEASQGKQRMLNHGKGEHPGRMAAQIVPVGDNEQKALRNQRGEHSKDRKIPHVCGIETNFARRALGEKKRKHNA